MQTRFIVATSIVSLVVGFLIAITLQRRTCGSHSSGDGSKILRGEVAPSALLYGLEEVRANRDEFDGRIITVVGGVYIQAGRPFLVPDDDVALLRERPSPERYSLSLPMWRFRDLQGVYNGIAVTGRFGKLDDNLGFDSLSPISSISWEVPPRGAAYDSVIDDEEYERIEAEQE